MSSIHSAVNRVSKILLGGCEKADYEQDSKGVLIVKSEGGAVNQTFLEPTPANPASDVNKQHFQVL